MSHRRLAALLALSGLTMVACSGSNGAGPGPSSEDGGADVVGTTTGDDASVTTTQRVGAGGGTVTASGVALDIPSGALPSNTTITVTNAGSTVPTGYVALSPLFQFGPDGTVFQQPVTVSFTISGGMYPAVYWSNAQGGYDELPTTVSGSTATATVTHFSRGFCGESHKHQAMDATAVVDDSGGSSSGSASSSGSSSSSSGGGSSGSASGGSSGGSSSGSSGAADATTGSSGSSGGSSSGTSSSSGAGSSSGSSGAVDASTGSSGGSSGGSSSGSSSSSGAGSSSGSSGAVDASTGSSGGSSGGSSSGSSSSSGSGSSSGSSGGAVDAGSITDAGSVDAAPPPGITVTINGVQKFFGYNVNAMAIQAWWVISANDSNGANGPYWNMTISTPMTTGASQCFLQGYPSITYSHYAGLNYPADTTFKANQCVMMESTNAQEAGSTAVGTFSGNMTEVTDSGNAPMETLTAGSYDVVVP